MAKISSIFKQLNYDETIDNVNVYLSWYRHYRMVLESGLSDACRIGDMTVKEYVDSCDDALARIADDDYHIILQDTYFSPLKEPDVNIMDTVALEHSAYYEAKRRAMIAFAECVPLLLVYIDK